MGFNRLGVPFLVAAMSVTCSTAAVITSYTRATFQAALSGGAAFGQDFDSLANGAILNTLDGVTYSASLGSPIVTDTYLTTTSPNGLGSTSTGFFLPTESATFAFATAISAFAIDVNTFAPSVGGYTATLNIGNVVPSKFDVFPGTATGQFLGFISDTPFNSVTINATSGYSYTLDSLVYGNAAAVTPFTGIPEPSTIALVGFGIVVLGLKVRKRS